MENEQKQNNIWFYLTIGLTTLILMGGIAYFAYSLGESQNRKVSTEISDNKVLTNNSMPQQTSANSYQPINSANMTTLSNPVPNSVPITPAKINVSGEMYIITNGRENIKLASVVICAVSENNILNWLKLKQSNAIPQIQKARVKENELREKLAQIDKSSVNTSSDDYYTQKYNRDMERINVESNLRMAQINTYYWQSPEYYLKGLNQCEVSTKTDSDGKFTLELPASKKYSLSAETSRRVFKSSETYWWLFWIDPTNQNQKITFNNDNLMSENPSNAVIQIRPMQITSR